MTKYQILKSLKDVEQFARWVKESSWPFTVDIETTGKDPRRDDIVGFSVAFIAGEEVATYVPIRHRYDQPFDGEVALKMFKPVFEARRFIAFNVPFDAEFLIHNADIHPNLETAIDVSLLTYAYGRYPANSLKVTTKVEFPSLEVDSYQGFMTKQGLRKTSTIAEAPIKEVAHYCGRDAVATLRLLNKLYPILKNNRIYKLEERLLPVVMWLRSNGVLIDRQFFEEEQKELNDELEILQQVIETQVSRKVGSKISFNIGSTDQLAKVLFDEMKVPAGTITKTGKRSTAKGVLQTLQWKYPVVRNIRFWKEIRKRATTYYDAYLDFIQKDKRIHSSYNQSGVPSGRFSSADPNLQNIPGKIDWDVVMENGKTSQISANTKQGFIVPDDCWLAEVDYSQIEARMAAGITQEVVLLNAFREGIDFHTKTASLIFNVAISGVSKYQRQMGKKLNFTLLYGAGEPKVFEELQKDMPIEFDKVRKFRQKYLEAYPRMFHGAEMIAKEALRAGYVETIFGRRVPIFVYDSDDNRQLQAAGRLAYNQKVQGSAADLAKVGMLKSYNLIKKNYGLDNIKMILMTHDSFAFEIKKKVELVEYFTDMTNELRYEREDFPDIFVEFAVGKNWGALQGREKGETLEGFVERVNSGTTKEKSSKGKVYVLELPKAGAKRTKKQVLEFRNLVTQHPGDNRIAIKVGGKEKLLPYDTSLTLEDKDKIQLIMGGKFYEKKKER